MDQITTKKGGRMNEPGKEVRFGWQGRVLTINLTNGDSGAFPLPPEDCRRFLGGVDLAAKLLYPRIPADTDPLGPENVLAVMTGPLTGTNYPGCGRVAICALSPLTGLWGQSIMGGFLGVSIKKAGWDGILIEGAAATPQYLLIENEEVQLLPAKDLWGLDTYKTESILRERHPRAEQFCIGPAGENLVPMACIAQRPGKLAGRTGMGAVLGSKNLKAVVVHGSLPLRWADQPSLNQLVVRANQILSSHPQTEMYRKFGTAGLAEGVMMMGDMPVQNWCGETWQKGVEKISGEAILEQILTKRSSCHACTVQCKPEVEVEQGDLVVEPGPGPEYETLGTFGTMLRQDNLAGVAKANQLCNRYGLDTISTGATIAWAMEAFERGDLTPAQVEGTSLIWGDTQAILQAIEAIAFRRGKLGELLHQGSRKAAKRLGGQSEAYAINVKGLELAMHHPRVFTGLALAYTFLPQGASHMEGGFNQRGHASLEAWIAETIKGMQKSALMNDLVLCSFTGGDAPMEFLCDLIESVSGVRYSEQDLRACVERGYLLRFSFNLRAGYQPAENQLPQRIVEQLTQVDKRWVDEWPLVPAAYYQARGFNQHGYPTAEALQTAGLEELIRL
jgi:aldehyde:ferredoxin oxidoreductase